MKKLIVISLLGGLTACSNTPRPSVIDGAILTELTAVKNAPIKPRPDAVLEQALIPPLQIELPRVNGSALEPRFDLSVRQAPAPQVFMSIVSGTRYSMLVHPDVVGAITVTLKDVTVKEALDSLRDLYGFDYKVEGTRIFIQSISMQTRVFRVSYLIGQRQGRTDIVVNSGITSGGGGGGASGGGAGGAGGGGGSSTGSSPIGARPGTSTQVATLTRNDFWADLQDSLRSIVGINAGQGGASAPASAAATGASSTGSGSSSEAGRSVVVNAQAGVVVVRAMPSEIRAVDQYLRSVRSAVERQVMLEAKIIEVTLGDAYQAGVNWALFPSNRGLGGLLQPGAQLGPTGPLNQGSLTSNPITRFLGNDSSSPASAFPFPLGSSSLFGLALQTRNFASLLQFLETQGAVQVLSSPRIAAVNNQKAVLKVGTEEYFVTNVTGGTAPATGGATGATATLPSLTVQPFFSGVALDILPQIDEDGHVILHVRPTVAQVEQDDRRISLGSLFGNITLPLARSTASETDSVVRVLDGSIVAIGGLMKIDSADNRSGLPGLQDSAVGGLFGSRRRSVIKREMVVLIKPTVVRSGHEMAEEAQRAADRMMDYNARPGFVTMPSTRNLQGAQGVQ